MKIHKKVNENLEPEKLIYFIVVRIKLNDTNKLTDDYPNPPRYNQVWQSVLN